MDKNDMQKLEERLKHRRPFVVLERPAPKAKAGPDEGRLMFELADDYVAVEAGTNWADSEPER